jgi:hypothetical protein
MASTPVAVIVPGLLFSLAAQLTGGATENSRSTAVSITVAGVSSSA